MSPDVCVRERLSKWKRGGEWECGLFTFSNRVEGRLPGFIQVLINRCDGGQQSRLIVCFPQRNR